ncbi:MAG TPA: tetratricopeptide repeat protein [Thermoanaerobaculia bacterium]
MIGSLPLLAADAKLCRDLVAVSVPGDSPGDAETFFANAEAAYRDCSGSGLSIEIRASAAANFGFANDIRGNYQTAVAAYGEALAVLENAKAAKPRTVLSVLDKAVRAELRAGLHSQALAHAERAAELRRSAFGIDSDDAVQGTVSLAMVHTELKQYDKAEAILQAALASVRKRCSEECRPLAEVYAGFSAFHAAQGNAAEVSRYEELLLHATPSPVRKHKD